MKNVFILCFVIIGITNTHNSQTNLVPNGGFENFVTCPNTLGQIDRATNWFSANTGTPDYFNSCAGNGFMSNVPNTHFGFQNAKEGNGFAGIILAHTGVFGLNTENIREYIEIMLSEELQTSKNYKISFYVNKANKSNYSTNKLGVLLSNTQVITSDLFVIPNTSILKNINVNFLNDTTNWNLIETEYIALGGEQYLIIGNFEDALNTDIIIENYGIFNHSYIYIDEVSLIENQLNSIEENEINLNIDFNHNLIKLQNENQLLEIFNSIGSLVLSTKETVTDVSSLKSGMYVLKVSENNKQTKIKKIII